MAYPKWTSPCTSEVTRVQDQPFRSTRWNHTQPPLDSMLFSTSFPNVSVNGNAKKNAKRARRLKKMEKGYVVQEHWTIVPLHSIRWSRITRTPLSLRILVHVFTETFDESVSSQMSRKIAESNLWRRARGASGRVNCKLALTKQVTRCLVKERLCSLPKSSSDESVRSLLETFGNCRQVHKSIKIWFIYLRARFRLLCPTIK